MTNEELLNLQNILSKANEGNINAIITIILERILSKGEETILNEISLNELDIILNIDNIDILNTNYIVIPYDNPELISYFSDYIVALYNDFTKKYDHDEVTNKIKNIVVDYMKNHQIVRLVDRPHYFRIEILKDKLNIINNSYNLSINDIDNSKYKRIIISKKINNKVKSKK